MAEDVERIKTGIAGLDSMLFGGIPAKNQVLLAGGPGAGKTLMTFEALYHNAKEGIPTAFIALDEQPEIILRNAKETFNKFTDIDALMKKKMLKVVGDPASRISAESGAETYNFGNVMSDIEGIIEDNDAALVAIDSISFFKLMLGNRLIYRKSMLTLASTLRKFGVTSIIATEMPSSERKDLKFTQEFFTFDGIIALYQNGQEDKRTLTLEIVKMRGSNHSRALAPYDITPQGFKIITIE